MYMCLLGAVTLIFMPQHSPAYRGFIAIVIAENTQYYNEGPTTLSTSAHGGTKYTIPRKYPPVPHTQRKVLVFHVD